MLEVAEAAAPSREELTTSLDELLQSALLDQRFGQLERHAREIKQLQGSIVSMLRRPQERGDFGEIRLETILSGQLSRSKFGVREQLSNGEKPDAHIGTVVGVVCIDSKFPLDTFRSYREAPTETERYRSNRTFRRDVRNHLEKIATDYVRPTEGTTEFAVIPSEGVSHHLVSREYDLLGEFTHRRVNRLAAHAQAQSRTNQIGRSCAAGE